MEQLQKQIDADMKAGNADKAQAEEAQYLALQTEAQLLEKIIAVQLQLKDSQASGNTQLSQILQDQLTTMQQQLAVAEAAVNGSETSGGLKSGLGSHPGLVGQPIQVSVTADNNFGSISSIKNAPYPTQTTASSDNSLTQQALQVQMDTVKAELEKAQAALLAAQQQANAPGQFGNPGIIKQEEMLNQQIQLLTQQMATLQKAYADAGGVTADNNFGSIGSIKNAPYPTSTSTVSASGYSSPPAQPDPQTLGFYAGALAELEDIRNTIHSERDLISSMRDSWVTIAKGMLVIMGSDGASQGHAMPKFEGGGDVPRTMIAQVEQGEHIIPSDISGMLRQMVRTPNYAQMTTPSYSDSKQVPKSVNITMPVTVNNARDGRQLAIDLTRHIKHMTSDGGAYSD